MPEVVIVDIHFRGEAEIRQFEGVESGPVGQFFYIGRASGERIYFPADRIVDVRSYIEKRYDEE